MSPIFGRAKKFVIQEEVGATMIEYAIMVFFIALVSIGAVAILGTTVLGAFTTVSTQF